MHLSTNRSVFSTTKNNTVAAWLAAAVAASIAGWQYWPTIHPGAGPARYLDSIQYQTAVATLGIPHPPGYPFYILIGKLFTLLPGIGQLAPFGDNIAYRLGIFSTVAAILTVFVTVLFIHRLTNNVGVAFFGGLILAGGRGFWIPATYVELYPLYTLMVTSWMLLMVIWRQTGKSRCYFAGTAVYALSFGVNVPAIILLPAWLWMVLITDHQMLTRWKNLWKTAVIVILAALQFIYVPLRALIFGPPNFCNFCPQTWSGIPAFLTGEIWRDQHIVFSLEPQHWLQRWGETGGEMMLQFWPLWLMIGGIGFWQLWKKNQQIASFITIALAGLWFFVITYRVVDWVDFLLPLLPIFTLFIGVGMAEIWGTIRENNGRRAIFAPVFAVILTILLITATFRHSHEIAVKFVEGNGSMTAHWAARSLLSQMEKDAWLLAPPTTTDGFNQTWIIRYVGWAESADFPDFTLIYPPRINDLLQTPGPKPGYLPWEEAEGDLSTHPLYVLELDDERLEKYGLRPLHDENGWPVGYQIIGEQTANGFTPWISAARFAELKDQLILP